ncbi:MAG: hypothetical protein C0501_13220 [Isosphaera sp.]|nr:hypothetical protein [Isosphaera sp.]
MPSPSHPDFRRTVSRTLRSPLVLALLVTAANALKPLAVDDTAYLMYARHVAADPLDPYGFEVFWYTAPQPAMTVLVPPVVPYWLAVGVAVCGEHVWALKLWMFPFVWAFAWSAGDLLRRFAGATGTRLLPLVVLSPAVLPLVNLMLDVPAVGLGLAAVVVFARAADRGSWRLAAAAGVLAALAMQTKYSALPVPVVVAWYGLTHRRVGLAAVAVGVAAAGFVGWEQVTVAKYGESHFAHHLRKQEPAATLWEKANLAPGLAGHLGCLGVGVGLVALGALGVPRRGLAVAAVALCVGFVRIVLVPPRLAAEEWDPHAGTVAFWQTVGWLVLAACVGCAVRSALRFGRRWGVRRDRASVFLAGWLLVELAGYFALTPFPAARRVIGLVVVGALVAARAAHRPGRRPPGWVVGFGVAAGVAVAALDVLDAYPEKACAERAAAVTADRPPGATVWYVGHWGFQFYCERAGMRPAFPGRVLMPGDLLVRPDYPEDGSFHRPDIERFPSRPPAWAAEPVADLVWDDGVFGRTVPNLYGGDSPVVSRDRPRLRVVVYRITKTWAVPGP